MKAMVGTVYGSFMQPKGKVSEQKKLGSPMEPRDGTGQMGIGMGEGSVTLSVPSPSDLG